MITYGTPGTPDARRSPSPTSGRRTRSSARAGPACRRTAARSPTTGASTAAAGRPPTGDQHGQPDGAGGRPHLRGVRDEHRWQGQRRDGHRPRDHHRPRRRRRTPGGSRPTSTDNEAPGTIRWDWNARERQPRRHREPARTRCSSTAADGRASAPRPSYTRSGSRPAPTRSQVRAVNKAGASGASGNASGTVNNPPLNPAGAIVANGARTPTAGLRFGLPRGRGAARRDNQAGNYTLTMQCESGWSSSTSTVYIGPSGEGASAASPGRCPPANASASSSPAPRRQPRPPLVHTAEWADMRRTALRSTDTAEPRKEETTCQ